MSNFAIGVLVAFEGTPHIKRPMQRIHNDPDYRVVYGNRLSQDQENHTLLEGERIHAIYDRFPFQRAEQQDPLPFATDIPICNPRAITLLCKDKWKLQLLLTKHNIFMPRVCRENFAQALQEWGMGVAKPQFGSFGTGIYRTQTPPPPTLPSINGSDPTIMQEWIQPPKDWAGMVVRQLIQRDVVQQWQIRRPVVRVSTENPIVNASRGAQVYPAQHILPPKTIAKVQEQSLAIARILEKEPEGDFFIEAGIDFVIDEEWKPWCIEINAQPKGRLKALAQTYHDEYQQNLRTPFECIKGILRAKKTKEPKGS